MKNVDWPLAILLAVMFVVMSVLRWRYFQKRLGRGGRTGGRTNGKTEKGTPD
jgi:hypothetical protein